MYLGGSKLVSIVFVTEMTSKEDIKHKISSEIPSAETTSHETSISNSDYNQMNTKTVYKYYFVFVLCVAYFVFVMNCVLNAFINATKSSNIINKNNPLFGGLLLSL